MLLGMWTTYPNNEQMIKDAKKFKLTDEFEETVSETMFFQCVSFRGWGAGGVGGFNFIFKKDISNNLSVFLNKK